METDVNGNSLTDFMEQLDWASLTQADQVRLIKVYEKSVEIHQTGLKKPQIAVKAQGVDRSHPSFRNVS